MPGEEASSVYFTFFGCFQMGQIWLPPFVRCAKFKRTNAVASNQKYLTGGQIWKWGKSIIIISTSTVLSLCFYLCIYAKSTSFVLNDMLGITIPTTQARKSSKSFWTAQEVEMAGKFVALLLLSTKFNTFISSRRWWWCWILSFSTSFVCEKKKNGFASYFPFLHLLKY